MRYRKMTWVYILFSPIFNLFFGATRANNQDVSNESRKPEAVLQVGHRRAIRAVAFSPDGRWLASGSKDNTIKIWDVATGRLLRTLFGHGSAVNALAVSPDGTLLASGSGNTYDIRYAQLFFKGGQVGGLNEDTTVRVWDVLTGRQVRVLTGHSLAVMALAFSADGHTLTSASSDVIKVWNVSSGADLRSLRVFPAPGRTAGQSIRHSFGPAISRKTDSHMDKWEKTFKQLASEIVISDRGEFVAAALPGKKFRLFDTVRMRKVQELDLAVTPGSPGSLAFSRDARFVAYIKNNKEIAVQDIGRSKDVWRAAISAAGHGGLVCFAPDGQNVIAELVDGKKRVLPRWSSATGKSSGSFTIADERLSRVLRLSPEGRSVAMVARGGHTFELRNANTGQLTRVFGGGGVQQSEPGLNDEALRKRLAAFGLTREGELSEAGEDVGDFSYSYREGEAVTFTLDGRWLLTKHGRPSAPITSIWDTATGTVVQDLTSKRFDNIGNPEQSPDGRFDTKPLYAAERPGAFNESVNIFAAMKDRGPGTQRVTLRDAHTGHKLHEFNEGVAREIGEVPAVGFSLDSTRIAVTGYKSRQFTPQIFIFDTKSGKKISQFESQEDQERGPIFALALNRDAGVLAAGFRTKDIELLDTKSGKSLAKIPHLGGSAALSFSVDGRLFALMGKDGDAYLFDAQEGHLLATLISVDNGDWLVVAPDGKFDGSPGGWNQILWRFSGETFNVAPVETFFNEFYYPGLLSEILAGKKLRTTRDFAQLDRRQPSLEIAADAGSGRDRNVNIKLKVTEARPDKDHTGGSGVRDVRLFRNGSLANTWRGGLDLNSSGEAFLEVNVPIVAGPNRLTAYAFNEDDIKSPEALLVVNGAPSLKRPGVVYVLGVGINEYSNAEYNLKFAVADAEDFSTELKAQQTKVGIAGKVEIVSLLNSEATKKNILLALRRLAGIDTGGLPSSAPAALEKLHPAQPEDEVFIYFAGHGAATDQRFYMIPYDLGYAGSRAGLDQAGWMSIMDHGISDLELEDALGKVDARDLVLVIDACNSGQALEAEERRRGPMNSRGLAQLAYEKGMYVLTAAQSYQAALEVKELGHGLLTFALVEEGLKTSAADKAPKDGKTVVREWMDYATVRVPELQEAQIAVAQKQGREISFAENEADQRGETKQRGLQRPRVFYRRELEPDPLIVARQ